MSNSDSNKIKHIRALQRLCPYETPINVKQVCNVLYRDDLRADYYAPMAYRVNVEVSQQPNQVLVVVPDVPLVPDKNELAPFAMEMAKRGLCVFVPDVGRGKDTLYRMVDNLFAFVRAMTSDDMQLGITLATPRQAGSVLVMAGCGGGALIAAIAVQLFGNAVMRAHFARYCPTVKAFFAMGDTPTVEFDALPIVGAYVSMGGLLHYPIATVRNQYTPWLGVKAGDKLYDWLSVVNNFYMEMPPVLLVTSEADSARRQTLLVQQQLQRLGLTCRVIDSPRYDEMRRETESLFYAYYPMWPVSRGVNDQIAAFCKAAGLPPATL